MRAAAQSGRELLGAEDPGEAVYAFIREILGRQQMDRGLFEAVAEEFLVRPEIRDAVTEVTGVLSELLDAGKRAGVIRPEVGALDVMMLVKGLCVSVAAFGDAGGGLVDRHVDLVFAAITTPAHSRPLRGRAPTLQDLESAQTAAVAGLRTLAADRGQSFPAA